MVINVQERIEFEILFDNMLSLIREMVEMIPPPT